MNRVLIAGEYSGRVRDAFIGAGWNALSCDLLPTEAPGPHYQGDVRDILGDGWDMMIAHPPCTRLCNSGVRWLKAPPPGKTIDEMQCDLEAGAELFSTLLNAPIARVAIENPVMHRHAKALISGYVPPAQSIQPWQFGHGETKRTCLWLKNLPLLKPVNIVEGREGRIHRMSPGPDRWKERSRTFEGIAQAMADQWG